MSKDMDFLTYDKKMTVAAMFKAIMEGIHDEENKKNNERRIEEMKKHGDIENYALFGYLAAMLMKDVTDSLLDDSKEEYKIIG